jgi:hypothetical protein
MRPPEAQAPSLILTEFVRDPRWLPRPSHIKELATPSARADRRRCRRCSPGAFARG